MCLSICIYIINAQWEGAWVRRSVGPSAFMNSVNLKANHFAAYALKMCVFCQCCFFFFVVLAVPSFFVIFVLEQFNFFAWLLFSGIVVLVGLCRWLRIIFGPVHDVMAKGAIGTRTSRKHVWYICILKVAPTWDKGTKWFRDRNRVANMSV